MPKKPKYKVVGSVKGEKGFLSQLHAAASYVDPLTQNFEVVAGLGVAPIFKTNKVF